MSANLEQLNTWYKTELGDLVFEAERAELAKVLSAYHKTTLVQLGGPTDRWLLSKDFSQNYIRVTATAPNYFRTLSHVQADYQQLPFSPNSIDIALIPHLLEFSTDPSAILDGLQALIAPEGCVVVLSFNPYSLWGIAKYLNRSKEFPWYAEKFRSEQQLKKWLITAGFTLVVQRSFFYRPPSQDKNNLNRWSLLESVGRLCWSNWGAVNLVVAKKTVVNMTPLLDEDYADVMSVAKPLLKPVSRNF